MNIKIAGGFIAALLCATTAVAQQDSSVSAIQNGIYQQMSSGSHGITVAIRNLHLVGNDVAGDAVVHWEENILGTRVVLIDGDYHFKTPSSELLYATRVNLGFGTSVKIKLDASYQPVRQACIDLHAEFFGGHVLEQRCSVIP
jgi:hypothetical protein